MNIGDEIWKVKRNLNMRANKINKIDDDGVEWHRYEAPRSTYVVTEGVITAIRTVKIVGNIIHADWVDEQGVRYTVQFSNGEVEEVHEEDIDSSIDGAHYAYFSSKGESETYMEEQFEKLK